MDARAAAAAAAAAREQTSGLAIWDSVSISSLAAAVPVDRREADRLDSQSVNHVWREIRSKYKQTDSG